MLILCSLNAHFTLPTKKLDSILTEHLLRMVRYFKVDKEEKTPMIGSRILQTYTDKWVVKSPSTF